MKFNRVGNNEHPVDTDNDMWLSGYLSLSDILEKVKEKWPDANIEDVEISSVNHHEYSVGYDLYDSSDYVQYIYVSLNKD
jgi:hypothetical protein